VLYDLTFLNIGEHWPPASEYDRIEKYKNNKSLFDNEHARVYNEAFKRIERVINNFQEVVSYPVIVNYQKLISLKEADLLLGEEPKITAGEPDSAEQKSIDAIKKNTDLINKAFEATIDVSRYGDGLLYICGDADPSKGGMIHVSQPPIWFPIVDPENIKVIKAHVLAWIIGESTDTPVLSVQIHEKGRYEKRQYRLEKSIGTSRMPNVTTEEIYKGRHSGFSIVSLIGSSFEQTKLDDFAIVQIPNVMTSERIHGMDDYSDVDSIVSELLVRVAQIARILDKHASPSVAGPTSSLEHDPVTGEWKLKMGNFFARDSKEDAPVEYITWDGQLDANFKFIEQLVNMLHAISEMGSQILGDKNEDGGALSGTALRMKMISPLAKVKRIAMRFRPALIKAIVLCSQLGGEGITDLSKADITIDFRDGLPNDPLEESTIIMNRTANGKSMSVKRALQVYDGMTPDDADIELEQIQEEEAAANPIVGMSTPFNGNNTPPKDPNAPPKPNDPNKQGGIGQ
jgi:hypothetical protein